MPERSKGLDSSSSVFVLVGSSPTECMIFSDSEVVITVDFESTIRSSNLRRRNSQVLHFNAGGLVDPATDDHEDDLWTSFLSCLIFLPGYCSTVFLLMLTPFFG